MTKACRSLVNFAATAALALFASVASAQTAPALKLDIGTGSVTIDSTGNQTYAGILQCVFLQRDGNAWKWQHQLERPDRHLQRLKHHRAHETGARFTRARSRLRPGYGQYRRNADGFVE
jgi:Ethanolamine utilization protein EutJ (predicted chaperonin)